MGPSETDMASSSTTDVRTGLALLLVRLASASVFLYHGSGILFGAFGGPGVVNFAHSMHYPPAVAFLVGLAEFGGGLAMLTGLLARFGAAGIAAVMLGAVVLVHWPHGFDIQRQGMEYALTQLLIALAILAAGPGPFTLVALLPGAGRNAPGATGSASGQP